jgi:hypothetical protein
MHAPPTLSRGTRNRVAALYVASMPVLAALLAVSACGKKEPSQRAIPAPVPPAPAVNTVDVRLDWGPTTEQDEAGYTGDAKCGVCHRGIVKECGDTNHRNTFRSVSAEREGPLFSMRQTIRDKRRGIRYSTVFENGHGYLVADDGVHHAQVSADYVFGSALNGYTFLTDLGSENLIVLRTSYYPKLKAWDFTPQQKPEQQIGSPAGMPLNHGETVRCVRCHVSLLRGDETHIDLSKSSLGISCERCHGPGLQHAKNAEAIAAAGNSHLPVSGLEDLSKANAGRIVELCGECHKTEARARRGDKYTEENLPRFQSAALVRSRCFQRSGTLTCTTCHDPHTNTNRVTADYEAVCKSCHSAHGAAIAARRDPTNAVTRVRPVDPGLGRATKVCPVNSENGCISCHMPRQTIPIPHVLPTNHWIKVWKGNRSNPPKQEGRSPV